MFWSSTVEDQQPLSSNGSDVFIENPTPNVGYIIIIIGFQTKKSIQKLLIANLGNTLLKHPRFCSRMRKYGGQLKWTINDCDAWESHKQAPIRSLSPIENIGKNKKDGGVAEGNLQYFLRTFVYEQLHS
ncbi:hypothetical protein NC653_041965 [Populus alba x Populus x berolinensis]|uniref:Uncharacterized protein n=1 Tax=Populus alba x Populus x berolinensis TaxID=444605 RepID=A0AAD6PQN9_9ROSI|nr:hypothetical protein NC653_041965 [Populus alba x Populus x berolinensis]